MPATTPRSCVIRIRAVCTSATTLRMRSRIWAWMVTSSAVVGSSAISSSGSQASAMAIITRCRMPPENWCGIVVQALLGAGNAHHLEQLDGAPLRAGMLELLVRLQHLGQLPLDGQDRVQRGHRVLEDHGQPIPAQLPQLVIVLAQQLIPVEDDGARRPGRRLGQEPQHGQRADAFATARLAHDPHRLAGSQVVADAIHRMHHPIARAEGHMQVADRQHRRGGQILRSAAGHRPDRHRRSLGSSASRMPSPSRLKPSTLSTMAMPGANTR